MDSLSIDIFIVPTIALSLVVLLYFYLKRWVKDLKMYNRTVLTVAITAFLLNLIWEVAQGPLYKGFKYDLKHVSFCALASVADMLMVLILFFGFALIYRDVYWTRKTGLGMMGVLMSVGGIGAIFAEMWHTKRGDWSYAEAMPLLPSVEVGVSPVLQFILLPWLVFAISNKIWDKKE